MRVRLKGINSRTKKLADGTVRTYHYAWKGGPPLHGAKGSPEFMAAYNAAVATKLQTKAGTLASVTTAYQSSSAWDKLAKRTRDDYAKKILAIESEFGSLPLKALTDRRMRGIFLEWRDKLAKRSKRQADLAWSVLALVLAWALSRHLVDANPCKAGGRLYKAGSRRDIVWTDELAADFLAKASPELRLAFLLALDTAQRQGDLLRMPWAAYDGESIRLEQGKTGARVRIPVTAALKRALDAAPRRAGTILTNQGGETWTADGFRSSWRKVCVKAGIKGVTFHDLRGTAVTRLAVAGCTEAQIASISGHSLSEVRSILEKHYLGQDYALAKTAIAKLEAATDLPDQAPDRAEVSETETEKA